MALELIGALLTSYMPSGNLMEAMPDFGSPTRPQYSKEPSLRLRFIVNCPPVVTAPRESRILNLVSPVDGTM